MKFELPRMRALTAARDEAKARYDVASQEHERASLVLFDAETQLGDSEIALLTYLKAHGVQDVQLDAIPVAPAPVLVEAVTAAPSLIPS